MGFLVPDITEPVRLTLSIDQAKREALGRTMGIAGTITGLVGAAMVLTANPAVAAALKKGTGINLVVAPETAKREALGKALAMIGTAVGLSGTALTMTADPKIVNRMPGFMQRNPGITAAAVGVGLTALAFYLIRAQQNSLLTSRYQKA